uniref:DUF58 domain-containing protein n=1 Tax=Thermofilum pendens TaxID=2269 RepID=A0A7J3X7T5_THEPE
MLTAKGWSTGALALAVLAAALLTQRAFLLLFGLPLLYSILASLSYEPPQPGEVEARRVVARARLMEGDEVEVSILVRNRSSRVLLLGVSEALAAPLEVVGGSPRGVFALRPGEEGRVAYRVRCGKRGHYKLGPALVEAYDPFLTRRCELLRVEPDEVAVFPRVPRGRRLGVRARFTAPHPGEVASRQPGEGGDFLEVREAPEPVLRRVNWRASAKHQRWMVNTFEGERRTNVLVVLDVGGERLLGKKVEEYVDALVGVAASVICSLINSGNSVSLLVVGNYRDWVRPGVGKRHMLRLLSSLADVRYTARRQIVSYREVFRRVSLLISPARSSVVVISSFTEGDALEIVSEAEAAGYAVLCIAVNPFSRSLVGEEKLHEVLTEAWRQGVLKVLPRRSRKVVLVMHP